MRKLLICALLLLPASAFGDPVNTSDRIPIDQVVAYQGPTYNCNAGGPASLVIGVAVAGLIARRRRDRA